MCKRGAAFCAVRVQPKSGEFEMVARLAGRAGAQTCKTAMGPRERSPGQTTSNEKEGKTKSNMLAT